MELVKKIKDAEAKATEMVDDAKAKAAEDKKNALKHQETALDELKKQRNQVIQNAVEKAEKQTSGEVAKYLGDAQQDRNQLKDKAQAKIDQCVQMVVEQIKSMG